MIYPSNDELLTQSKDLLTKVGDVVCSSDVTPEILLISAETLRNLAEGLERISCMMQDGVL